MGLHKQVALLIQLVQIPVTESYDVLLCGLELVFKRQLVRVELERLVQVVQVFEAALRKRCRLR